MEFEYKRKINYYETDKMGIVHHSNYIRFLEEARCIWLEEANIPMSKLEANGVTIPTLDVYCKYKTPVTVGDVIIIKPIKTEYNGIRMKVEYKVTNEKTGKEVIEAFTNHCFTNNELKPINLKKVNKEYYDIFDKI